MNKYQQINGALNIMFLTGLGGFIAQSLEEHLFRWIRAAELTCDRAALLVAKDPKVYKFRNCMFYYILTLSSRSYLD